MNSRNLLLSYLSVITGSCLIGIAAYQLIHEPALLFLAGLFLVLQPILTNTLISWHCACKTLTASACASLSASGYAVTIHYAHSPLEITAVFIITGLLVLFAADHVLKLFPREAQ